MTDAVKPSKGFFGDLVDGAKAAVDDIKSEVSSAIDLVKKDPLAAAGGAVLLGSGLGTVVLGATEIPRGLYDKYQTAEKLWDAAKSGSMKDVVRHGATAIFKDKVKDLMKALAIAGASPKEAAQVPAAASQVSKALPQAAPVVRAASNAFGKVVFDRLRSVTTAMEKRFLKKAHQGKLTEGFIADQARRTLNKIDRLVDKNLSGQPLVKSRLNAEVQVAAEQAKRLITTSRPPAREPFTAEPLDRKWSAWQWEALAGKRQRFHAWLSDKKGTQRELRQVGQQVRTYYNLAIKRYAQNGQHAKARELQQTLAQFESGPTAMPMAARAASGALPSRFREIREAGELPIPLVSARPPQMAPATAAGAELKSSLKIGDQWVRIEMSASSNAKSVNAAVSDGGRTLHFSVNLQGTSRQVATVVRDGKHVRGQVDLPYSLPPEPMIRTIYSALSQKIRESGSVQKALDWLKHESYWAKAGLLSF